MIVKDRLFMDKFEIPPIKRKTTLADILEFIAIIIIAIFVGWNMDFTGNDDDFYDW